MPSSTSSSDAQAASRRGAWASAILLAIVATLLAGSELLCRLAVPRISKIERRVVEEHRSVVETGSQAKPPRQVVVLGNSLLDAGVRFDDARRSLSPEIDARRFVVEDTSCLDWYYGLRRLYREGARPDVVVLVLSPQQLVASGVRGDYFAYHLLQVGDVLRVARDADLSNTQASNLAFASRSAFLGLRTQVRRVVAGEIFPGLPQLTAIMLPKAPELKADAVRAPATARLAALGQLASAWGSTVILVIPPAGDKAAISSAVQQAGASAGVAVLVPVAPGSLPADFYADGFHLNERGADFFTPRFVAALREAIAERQAVAPE
jgi:hypothetical protein